MTILDFAETINQITNNPGGIRYEPLPVDDPKQRQPNITRARTILDWEPRVPLAEGMAQTIAYFEQQLASGE